jgi:signal peptidase II
MFIRKIIFVNIIIFIFFLFDRMIKWHVIQKEGFFIIPNFLKINFYPNWGVALSISVNPILIYLLISLILLIVFYFLFESYGRKNYILIWALTLIFVGALSNLIDRFRFGYVVDYINFVGWYPVFNLADVMIVVGVGLIIGKQLVFRKRFDDK